MPVFPIPLPTRTDEAPVLLVLLPTVSADLAAQAWTATTAMLNLLQTQLAAAIRVIRIDAASYPAVVRSFDGKSLPAFVLLSTASRCGGSRACPRTSPSWRSC